MDDISTLEEVILRSGAIAMALSAMAGFIVFIVRLAIIRPLDAKLDQHARQTKDDLDSRLTAMEKVGDERHREAVERYRTVEYELRSNGGGSLRDDVRAARSRIEQVHEEVVRQNTRHAAWAKSVQHDLAQRDISIPDPDDYHMGDTE